jgi:modification methylase
LFTKATPVTCRVIEAAGAHLVCTSPPYGSLKTYPDHDGQLGNIACYDRFLDELDAVWSEYLCILVPGGRIACVVGNVCISRRAAGRQRILPLSADLQVRARKQGFDILTPYSLDEGGEYQARRRRDPARFLGKPNLPNAVVKNDIEHILFFRKRGGYRKPTPEMGAAVADRNRRLR